MNYIENFSWDDYVKHTAYSKVMDGVRYKTAYMPTIFSPCKKFIYLRTWDIKINVNDIELLKKAYDDLIRRIKERMLQPYWNAKSLHLLQYDYLVLQELLIGLDVLPDYHHPEDPFEKELDILKAIYGKIDSEIRST